MRGGGGGGGCFGEKVKNIKLVQIPRNDTGSILDCLRIPIFKRQI